MKRVAVVVVAALLNAVMFGVTGSASPLQTSVQDRELARQASIAQSARRIPPGAAVRIERLDGTRVEGLFDRVNGDELEILQVTKNHRTTIMVPIANVKRISPLRGGGLSSFAKRTGIALALLVGACAGLAAVASAGR